MKAPKEILNKMVDEMPFKIPPHVFPYIEEAMKLYAEESVKEMLAEKDKEIKRLKSDVNKLNLLSYQNELNFNKICNCIHKGKSTSALCTGMCNR